jgi:hypothetical protein
MKKKKESRVGFFVLAFLPGIFLGAIHQIFSYTEFYWNSGWWWLDNPLHLLGGACLAFAAAILTTDAIKRKRLPKIPWYFFAAFIMGAVMIIGVLWEFYEFIFDVFNPVVVRQSSVADTVKDLANDLLGGFITVLFFKTYYFSRVFGKTISSAPTNKKKETRRFP